MDLRNQPFPKRFTRACDLFGWVWLDSEMWLERGKPIIKIRKLNLCLLQRRENAVQRTPPRAHSAGADYGIYNVLNWNAEEGESSAFQCTTY